MRRLDKLNNNDLLNESHFPVMAIFNELYLDKFQSTVVNYISKGYGFGVEYGACVFPNDLDEYEIEINGDFEGVEFGLHNGEEILLNYDQFYYYLQKVCNSYYEEFPEHRQSIKKAVDIFKLNYLNNYNKRL